MGRVGCPQQTGGNSFFPCLWCRQILLRYPRMKIGEAHKLFLSYGRGERNYAPETLVTQRGAFRRWIVPMLGDIDVGALTRMDVIRLRTAMVDQKIGIAHQYSILMTLKVFCKFCRRVLKRDCLDPDREIQLPQRPKPFVHYLTNAEVGRLREALEVGIFTGLRMRTLVEVLLTTGLRISEALSLDRAPFEAGETEVQIIGKGNKPRIVYFPDSTLGWIKRFLRFRVDECPAVFVTTGIPRRSARSHHTQHILRFGRYHDKCGQCLLECDVSSHSGRTEIQRGSGGDDSAVLRRIRL
jgi:site-specific recombinase XerD